MLLRAAPLLLLVACDAGPTAAQFALGPPGGPYEKDVRVVADEEAAFEGRIVNEGGAAAAPALSFSQLACMTLDHDFDGELATGATVTFPIRVTADTSCHVQTIVDWFVDAPEGSSRGTFNVLLALE